MITRTTPLPVQPDHLVVAALTLREGCDWVEDRLGVRPQPGGQHVAMGTHNALLSLGPRFYLEVIAIDPNGVKPRRPRWFDLGEPRLSAALTEGAQLIHWVARTDALDAAVDRLPDLGAPMSMARSEFRWRITVPDDGHRPGRGLVPTLIEWSSAQHPSDALEETHLQLIAIAGEHPEPAQIRAALATLGLSETMKVTYGRSPRLAAMIRTARGIATL